MSNGTLFEFEQDMSRADVATYLRTIADKLEDSGELDFSAADQSTSVQVPDHVEFEIELEHESNDRGSSEIDLELEIEWYETSEGSIAGPGSLEIE
ncbi:MAG: amphi-Trp domain-containing protein [Salinibacter sp.]|uniref:amphi-Trp domain-containing protein n=1 Tax=Salinibacter sp. TaxID=2065818 RepID=UPI0035D46D03